MITTLSVYQVSKDGAVLRLENDDISSTFNEIQRRLPEGVYTTFRTFRQTQAVRLSDHLQRLEESAALLEKPIELNRSKVRAALASIIQMAGYPESRLRLSVDLQVHPGLLYVLIESLSTPSKVEYEKGVAVITRTLHRENPKAKSTSFIQKAEAVRLEMDGEINEIIMVSDDGLFLEGLSSNFFAILGGAVWTADEGVLYGITRGIVLHAKNGGRRTP